MLRSAGRWVFNRAMPNERKIRLPYKSVVPGLVPRVTKAIPVKPMPRMLANFRFLNDFRTMPPWMIKANMPRYKKI